MGKAEPDLAGKITGMLLEFPLNDLTRLVAEPEKLAEEVHKAMCILQNHSDTRTEALGDSPGRTSWASDDESDPGRIMTEGEIKANAEKLRGRGGMPSRQQRSKKSGDDAHKRFQELLNGKQVQSFLGTLDKLRKQEGVAQPEKPDAGNNAATKCSCSACGKTHGKKMTASKFCPD